MNAYSLSPFTGVKHRPTDDEFPQITAPEADTKTASFFLEFAEPLEFSHSIIRFPGGSIPWDGV